MSEARLTVPLSALHKHPDNPRYHPEEQLARLAADYQAFGQQKPLVVWRGEADNPVTPLLPPGEYWIVTGHGFSEGMKRAGAEEAWVNPLPDNWPPSLVNGLMLADNMGGAEDNPALQLQLARQAQNAGISLAAIGFNEEELEALAEKGRAALAGLAAMSAGQEAAPPSELQEAFRTLAERFGAPPFSVLDSRQGYWQARKQAWLKLGARSLHGAVVTGGQEAAQNSYPYRASELAVAKAEGRVKGETSKGHYKLMAKSAPGRSLMPAMGQPRGVGLAMRGDNNGNAFDTAAPSVSATSSFDPVLTELVYHWFLPAINPPRATNEPGRFRIFDPFAGSSVAGFVAGMLGYSFIGVDIREEQVELNNLHWQSQRNRRAQPAWDKGASYGDISLNNNGHVIGPTWLTGDSRQLDKVLPGQASSFDLLYTCPPYFDLEVYSALEGDLSNRADYLDFLADYQQVIDGAARLLKPNRFAVFVVTNIRGGGGLYHNLVNDTIVACEHAGLRFYNDAVLITVAGTLPIRVGRMFNGYRKLGKQHQNVLVFYKGDNPALIPEEFGEVPDIHNLAVEDSESDYEYQPD